ncbi:HNH endonuclease [Rubrivivax gelatinosus]|uniref:HNH endonuclease n=1 Tax=Rubrivivax gelatinosus TaxID=28068 RepID=A0A4R2MHU3_RUBGE|nr:HNH endonuclease [Rubrivivax gelatinosus]TCP04457.1 HNH endonuclease [Rubrivivax gelatinosus]
MIESFLSDFRGSPLSEPHRSFLRKSVDRGFDVFVTGVAQKTIRLSWKAKDVGYINGDVVRRKALLGLHFASFGRATDACPPQVASDPNSWVVNTFGAVPSDFVIHRGTGSNKNNIYILLRSEVLAWRLICDAAGIASFDDAVVTRSRGLYLEGRIVEVISSGRERDPHARQACLDHYGFDCRACGVNIKRRYFGLPTELVHVHHETPLSLLPGETAINPVEDLKPLCPNCHSVAHSKTPPYSVDQLIEMVRRGSLV